MKIDPEQYLSKFAALILKVGLNLQPGQRLFITATPLEVAPLVREVARQAYLHQSRYVNVQWFDEILDQVRLVNAPGDSFEEFPAWNARALLACLERGDAYLQIWGQDPCLFQEADQEHLNILNRVEAQHLHPIRALVSKNAMQWLFVSPPTPAWASRVFPGADLNEALNKLWEAVVKILHLDEPDPVAFWKSHLDQLLARAEYLTARSYQAITFQGPGTDLTVGLPEGHLWLGGWDRTPEGMLFCGNLPTEELYTLPDRLRVDGTVTATRPLSYQGKIIQDFSLTFKEGRVVDFTARTGLETLKGILDTDPRAAYLGELALVPHWTPISRSGLVFLNTLYDENASCHLALGRAYRSSLQGGGEMTPEEFLQAGGNESLIHEDFMFGREDLDVDGIRQDGKAEALMRGGEWAFQIQD